MPPSNGRLFAFCMMAVISLPVMSQTPPNASRALEIITTPPDLAGKPDVSLPQPAAPQVGVERTADTDYRFLVNDFRLSGAKRFPEADLKALLAEFTGRKITLAELNAGTERISKHYRDHALPFVQVFIPPQDVTEGVVEIRIVEGRVGKIETRVANGSRIKPVVAAGLGEAFPLGSPIDYSVLTRQILLLNDLPGIQAKVDLGPGDSIGDVGLTLNLSDRGPLAGFSMDLDNHGNRTIGEARIGGTLRLNNLNGIGDQFVARLQHSSGNGVNSGQLSYQRPIGMQGLKLGGQVSKTSYETGKEFAGLEGNGVTWNLNASYPLQRSRGNNLNINGALEYRDLEDSGLGRDLTLLTLGLEGDVTDNWRGGGVTSYSLSVNLGEVDNDAALAIRGSYAKLSWDVQRRQFLGEKHTLLGKFRGQLPTTNLDTSEKISLGGPNGIRAYPVGDSPSDTALLASLEWQYSLGVVGKGFTLIPNVFVDYGFSKLDKDPSISPNTRHLWGVGAGLLAFKPNVAQFSLALARRADGDPQQSLVDDDRYRLWLQAVVSF